jgi:hypothetical protein
VGGGSDNMAEPDYFNVGMVVSCVTCHGMTIKGEVVAFDYPSKMLAIKSQPKSGRPNTNAMQFLNLSFVSNVEVIKEAPDGSTQPPPLPNLNYSKLSSRFKNNVEDKMRKLGYIGVGVSSVGQGLVDTITKTLSEVKWDGQSIIILDQVTIVPPYTIDDCSTKDPNGQQALQHVRKLVEKYHKDNIATTLTTPTST